MAAVVGAPAPAHAQTATVYGMLGNFDVVNSTGRDAHGFEVELEGVQAADVLYTFSGQRYGSPTVVSSGTGVSVRWTSAWDQAAGRFAQTTMPHAPNTPFGGTCYMGGAGYDASGCEHFGVHLTANPTSSTYRWLIGDPVSPGALLALDPPVAIPTPTWTVAPPVQAGAAPALAAEIQPAEAAEQPELYGDAQWARIFKAEMTREVGLDELLSDNPVVPRDATQVETAWDVLQASPPGGSQRRHRNQGSLDPRTRAVVRRYELYRYTGAYDPVTHQAVCGGDGTCSAPLDGELGDYIGAQMAAANVQVNAVIVAKTGAGTVSSPDKLISCGSTCTASANAGQIVTLAATASSGNAFAGWSGACAGTDPTCVVTVNGALEVGASFRTAYTLSIGRSGKGSVVSAPAGLDCGKSCSAKFAQGTVVTLTATPESGAFTGWSGDCAGAAPTCTVTINRDAKVQANFR